MSGQWPWTVRPAAGRVRGGARRAVQWNRGPRRAGGAAWRTADRWSTDSRIWRRCGRRSRRCTGGCPTTLSDQFAPSVAPADVAFCDPDDLHLGAQRVAREMVRHYRLPDARMIVSFREMEHAANVELAAGPEYFIELNDRFRTHRRDIGAALAHEVTHVYCTGSGCRSPARGTTRSSPTPRRPIWGRAGCCWTRTGRTRRRSQKLGYLTPEEFGYVLAKRALVFGEDPSVWFTSPQAYEAYAEGMALARRDEQQPPLTAAGWAGRPPYARDRRHALDRAGAVPAGRRRLRTPSRRPRRRCGCPSPAPPAISASGCRYGAGCGRAAGCAGRCWSATPETAAAVTPSDPGSARGGTERVPAARVWPWWGLSSRPAFTMGPCLLPARHLCLVLFASSAWCIDDGLCRR